MAASEGLTNHTLRMPAALYRKLKKVAAAERRSVTQTVNTAVEEYVNRANTKPEGGSQ